MPEGFLKRDVIFASDQSEENADAPSKRAAVLAWEREQQELRSRRYLVRGRDGKHIEVAGTEDGYSFFVNGSNVIVPGTLEDGINAITRPDDMDRPYIIKAVTRIEFIEEGKPDCVYMLTGYPLDTV